MHTVLTMISEDIPSESNAVQIYSPSILFFVLTPVFVALRFWSRGVRRSGLGWDDTTIVISFVSPTSDIEDLRG
jgi:hypothetical protein